MSDNEIVSFLGRKIEQAMNDEDGDISDVRVQALNLYVGKPFGNERDGYSSVVTREAMETVEWALPSLLRVFASGDRVVSYDPVGEEDEEQAEQETDIANHYLLKENNGFLALHHWLKDILMYPNGYVKLWVQEEEKTRVERYQGLTQMGLMQVLMQLEAKGEIEILEQDSYTKPFVDDFGQQSMLECFDIRVRVTWMDKTLRLIPLPPDEVLVDNDCLSIDLDDADFVCHRVRKSFTQLVREGYDPEQLELVGESEDYQWLDERTNRLYYEDEDPDSENEDDPSMREFWVHECFCYVDTDGDGLAEHRKIVMIGAEIMENEEVDYQPIIAAAAIMLPHKHTGVSYIDLVKDIQEIKSTLWRQLLDNVYKMNVRRKYVGDAFISDEGGTLDVLLDNTSEFIPARDPTAITEEMVQPIVSDLLPVIQGLNDLQNVRSGVSPQLSLDPNVLQQSTMGAFANALEQASQRIEMMVRVFAETGMKQLMAKAHQLLREFVDQPKTLKIRGRWVEFNPTDWHERQNISVNVGLGFNNKDQKITMLMNLFQLQMQTMPMGVAMPQNLYNLMETIVEASGAGNVQQYFTDPSTQPPPEPAPDPTQMLAQIEMQKTQVESQKAQMDFQLKQAQMEKDYEFRIGELQMKMREMEEKLRNVGADTKLKDAQRLKTLEDARAQDIENDAAETGVTDILEGFNGG